MPEGFEVDDVIAQRMAHIRYVLNAQGWTIEKLQHDGREVVLIARLARPRMVFLSRRGFSEVGG